MKPFVFKKKLISQTEDDTWTIEPHHNMQVPAIIYASANLIDFLDNKVYEQLCNVASLPGICEAAYAMPDAHWGYGFPIGGVAAFCPNQNGIICAGGVGFDISCGVRLLRTGLTKAEILQYQQKLADNLYNHIPAGVGSHSRIQLTDNQVDAMLTQGAKWAVNEGLGLPEDLEYMEEHGCMQGANPDKVSMHAKTRQKPEMGTLGSGNHYLEIQEVAEIFDKKTAETFGLNLGEAVISIHCGSRGLGHQIGTDYLKQMLLEAPKHDIHLPDKELACAPIHSEIGRAYLGAMQAGINCAFANREIITHFTREVFNDLFPKATLSLVYDVSHNTCKEETHQIAGKTRQLFVHRKGATRAFGPQHPDIPAKYQSVGQPIFIGGSMGTSSYVLTGIQQELPLAFSSTCHGAGRTLSRTQARKRWKGKEILTELETKGIYIRSKTIRGIAEEAPLAYKDVTEVVDSAQNAKLAKKVAKLKPLICIKG